MVGWLTCHASIQPVELSCLSWSVLVGRTQSLLGDMGRTTFCTCIACSAVCHYHGRQHVGPFLPLRHTLDDKTVRPANNAISKPTGKDFERKKRASTDPCSLVQSSLMRFWFFKYPNDLLSGKLVHIPPVASAPSAVRLPLRWTACDTE